MDDPVSIGEAGAHEIEAVRRLFRDYAGTLPFDLAYQGFEQELAGLPQPYAAPTGALLVARDGQARVLGTVGVRRLQDDIAEIKCLYVDPAGRAPAIRPPPLANPLSS